MRVILYSLDCSAPRERGGPRCKGQDHEEKKRFATDTRPLLSNLLVLFTAENNLFPSRGHPFPSLPTLRSSWIRVARP